MNYTGKIYAKIAGEYVELDQTSEDIDKLADENKKLRSKIQELQKGHVANVNGCWVDCKESLPELVQKPYTDYEYSENVLAWCDGKLMVLCLCFGRTDSQEIGEEYGYWWANCHCDISSDDAEWDDDYKPTHWMPLPTEPSV